MMATLHRFKCTDNNPEGPDRQTASLGGLAISLAVVVACLFLVKTLHQKAVIEDCLLSDWTNCDVLVTGDSVEAGDLIPVIRPTPGRLIHPERKPTSCSDAHSS